MNNETIRSKAEQGDSVSQLMLSTMYAKGIDFEQDLNEAFKWCEMAAKSGHPQAQYELGEMYAHGLGVNQDHDQKIKYYHLSAEQGYSDAQFQLSSYYLEVQNYLEAFKWISLACSKSSGDTFKKYTQIKDSISKHLTNEQMIMATKEGKKL